MFIIILTAVVIIINLYAHLGIVILRAVEQLHKKIHTVGYSIKFCIKQFKILVMTGRKKIDKTTAHPLLPHHETGKAMLITSRKIPNCMKRKQLVFVV